MIGWARNFSSVRNVSELNQVMHNTNGMIYNPLNTWERISVSWHPYSYPTMNVSPT